MKKITQCPNCKENELCLEVNDDEGVEEIEWYDALSEKKKGAQIIECTCGANLIIKKQIEIDNKIQEKETAKEAELERQAKQNSVKEAMEKALRDKKNKEAFERDAAWTEKRIQDREARIIKECKEIQSDVLITKFYNLLPLENLKSILEKGILCHTLLEEEKIPHKDITNKKIMENRRKEKFIKGNKSLYDFTNLYFNARNAMMYAVTRDKDRGNISSEFAVIEIEIDIRKSYCEIPVYISDINAARNASTFYDAQRLSLETYKKIKEFATSTYDGWNKAETQAECLIENKISTNYFKRIHVCCDEMVDKVRTLTQSKLPIYKNPGMFFM